jgi:hypothetical protein
MPVCYENPRMKKYLEKEGKGGGETARIEYNMVSAKSHAFCLLLCASLSVMCRTVDAKVSTNIQLRKNVMYTVQ